MQQKVSEEDDKPKSADIISSPMHSSSLKHAIPPDSEQEHNSDLPNGDSQIFV